MSNRFLFDGLAGLGGALNTKKNNDVQSFDKHAASLLKKQTSKLKKKDRMFENEREKSAQMIKQEGLSRSNAVQSVLDFFAVYKKVHHIYYGSLSKDDAEFNVSSREQSNYERARNAFSRRTNMFQDNDSSLFDFISKVVTTAAGVGTVGTSAVGAGMSAGMSAVLGLAGLVATPAVAAFAANSKVKKKRNLAQKNLPRYERSSIDIDYLLRKLQKMCRAYSGIQSKRSKHIQAVSKVLDAKKDSSGMIDYRLLERSEKDDFFTAVSYARELKEILNTTIYNEKWEISPEAKRIVSKYT